MKASFRLTKAGCYLTNISMSVVATLSPLLFVTFRQTYGISYGMLGLLVLINFSSQLGIDLVFSFFSHRFRIPLVVRLTPVLTVIGLVLYAVFPLCFPGHAYIGLAAGTVLFSSSAGLAEVLISPVIAALPSDDPDRAMSLLHSVYAWGVVGVVIVSTLFLRAFGSQRWHILALLWCVVPLAGAACFSLGQMPPLATPERAANVLLLLRNSTLILCVVCIFLGGAAECTMAQWSSSYLESALGISKVWGDICGVAMFAFTQAVGRTLYAKRGKKIYRVLLLGMLGAFACYWIAALSSAAVVGLVACALTGLCVSMLWPGSLIIVAEHIPNATVSVYALMAAGGDLGASVGPELVGLVTDAASASPRLLSLASHIGLTAEQIGMKAGLFAAGLFPLIGIGVVLLLWRRAVRK